MRPRKLHADDEAELKRLLIMRREVALKRLTERFGVTRQTIWRMEQELTNERLSEGSRETRREVRKPRPLSDTELSRLVSKLQSAP